MCTLRQRQGEELQQQKKKRRRGRESHPVDYMLMKASDMVNKGESIEEHEGEKGVNEGMPMLLGKYRRSKTIQVHVLPSTDI